MQSVLLADDDGRRTSCGLSADCTVTGTTSSRRFLTFDVANIVLPHGGSSMRRAAICTDVQNV